MDIPIIEEIIKPKLFGKSLNIRTNVDEAIAVIIMGLDFKYGMTIPMNVADIANSSPQSFISGNELPKIIPTTVKICQFK